MPIRYEWTPEQKQQAEAANQWIMEALSKVMPGSAYMGTEQYQPLAQPIANALAPATLEEAMQGAFNSIGVGPLLTKQPPIPKPDWLNAAKNYFKTTDDPYKAGYILPSGEMLDFGGSGKFARNIDHVEVTKLLPEMGGWPKSEEMGWFGNESWPMSPDKFTDITNSLRMSLMKEGGPLWVSMTKVPSTQQLKTIKNILPYVEANKTKPNMPNIMVDLVNLHEPTRPLTTSYETNTLPELIRWLESKFGDYK